MNNSKALNIKRRLIKSWPLRNKIRLANLLLPPRKNFKEIVFFDDNLLLHTSNQSYVEWLLYSSGEYESELKHIFNTYILPGATCLDIGANVGINALRMAKAAGEKGKVLAFEPIPDTAKRLKENIELNHQGDKIKIHELALSDKKERIKVKYPLDNGFNYGAVSLFFQDEKNFREVDVVVGDEYLESLNLSRLDFIKIDVEGFEWLVIKGLQRSIKLHKPYLIFEFMLAGTNTYLNIDPVDIFSFFKELNYRLFSIEDLGLKPITNMNDFPNAGNIFCLPKR